jgi:hypothetical protein
MTFSLSAFQPNRKTFSQMTFSVEGSPLAVSFSAFQPFSQILSAFQPNDSWTN